MDDVLGYDGRRVIVTGAASGMGEATARILVELGAELTAIDIKPVEIDGVAEHLEVDLRDRAAVEGAAAKVDAPVHAFFNCAGLPGPPFSDLDVMLVNFVGARHLIEGVLPAMPEGTAIAYVASNAGLGWQQQLDTLRGLVDAEGFDAGKAWCEAHPEAIGASAYAFSKQVINAWVASQAGDYLARGVRLNCTNPGPTETPMMSYFHESVGKGIVDAAMGPLARYSTPEEQAWPLVFLNSPRLSYVAGEALYVDGGFFGALQTGQVDFSKFTAAE